MVFEEWAFVGAGESREMRRRVGHVKGYTVDTLAKKIQASGNFLPTYKRVISEEHYKGFRDNPKFGENMTVSIQANTLVFTFENKLMYVVSVKEESAVLHGGEIHPVETLRPIQIPLNRREEAALMMLAFGVNPVFLGVEKEKAQYGFQGDSN